MRTIVKLVAVGLTDGEATEIIVKDNPSQYPTEESIKSLAGMCLGCLHSMSDDCLMEAAAKLSADATKQICLYAMMKKNRLV